MIYDLRFKIIYWLIGLLVVLVCIGSILAQRAKASALSLSIDPSIIEINAIPPSTATSNLTIQNKSNAEVVLQIQLKPFEAKSENGQLQYLDNDFLLLKNIQILDNGVPIESVTLGKAQQKNLTLTINIPQGTKISDYYFSIVFVSQSTVSSASTSSFNRLGIASNVLLSIGAKEAPDAAIEEFSAGLFYESGPVPFTLRIKNKGTHFIKPKGEILIKNMFGQNIRKLDLMNVNILSDSIRAIPNDLNIDFKSPKAVWKEDFLLGFYTATLNISLSNDGPSFTKSIRFFAFPFQGLIVIVIVLISAIIVVNRVRSHIGK